MSDISNISLSSTSAFASVAPQSGQSLQPFSNLDLSEQQRSQLRSIFQSAKQQGLSKQQVQQNIDSVLTPAQQKLFSADRAEKPGHHPQGGGGAAVQTTTAADATPATEPANQ